MAAQGTLSRLRNLGPETERWLGAIGVRTPKALARLGAVGAYRILRGHGYPVTLNLAYAIEGALRDRDWRRLPAGIRTGLKAAVAEENRPRCPWPGYDALMRRYHDAEWGAPVHDDRKHFEFLVLESAQAGLSWRTILHKREGYREAFAGFDPREVARYDARRVKSLLTNPAIVRNRLKIEATVANARAFLEVQEAFGSFDRYVWRFVGGQPIVNRRESLAQLPARTAESDALSADLKRRGFKFLGSTVVYAHMQAVGMVNDHLAGCFRYRQLTRPIRPKRRT
jgi:DNA-3-methyladenine glycosylase I